MSEIIKIIDKIICNIKRKIDSQGITYTDSKAILTLEIVRLEILDKNRVTDYSLRALKEISGMSYHNYKVDSPETYSLIGRLMDKMTDYNPKVYSADLEILGFEHEKWCNYFDGSIRHLLGSLDYYTKKSKD